MLGISCSTSADYLDDTGYRRLAAQSGVEVPTGLGVRIDQVEAPTGGGADDPVYRANPADSAFAGVTFHDQTQGSNPAFSSHATGVARLFAGNDSMSPGVADVDAYEANDWIEKVLFDSGTGLQRPVPGTGVLANHSWVGSTEVPGAAVDLLQRLDWMIEQSNYVHAVGVGSAINPLLSNGYNVIGVTYSGNTQSRLMAALDSFYVAGRAFPHLVAPRNSPSEATAVVSSAAALLLDAAADLPLRADTVKALLMAGAARVTRNSATTNLRAYHAGTSNGLDPRYGAGQLDIERSMAMLAAGRHASVEDGGVQAASIGYDQDSAFGGAGGSNVVATYPTGVLPRSGRLYASLAWHARIVDTAGAFQPSLRIVDNLDLQLLDVTHLPAVPVAASASVIDNTETLAVDVLAGRTYQLRVDYAGSALARGYAIAWRVEDDRDRDALFDRFETAGCPAVDDADSDDDGLADGEEDRNQDGAVSADETDPCRADTDGDGVQDGTELGAVAPLAAPGEGLSGTDSAQFVADAEPSTTTSPTDADSDGDGIADGEEDANRNGAVDEGESDPADADSVPITTERVPMLPPEAVAVLLATLLALGWAANGRSAE